jgi:chromosome segregation ATPase
MDVRESQDTKLGYKTSARVQAWFLGRSRRRWKKKYQALKVEAKRQQNRVNDVTKSREKWRSDARELSRRVRELEAENAVLQERTAALKKYGHHAVGSGRG